MARSVAVCIGHGGICIVASLERAVRAGWTDAAPIDDPPWVLASGRRRMADEHPVATLDSVRTSQGSLRLLLLLLLLLALTASRFGLGSSHRTARGRFIH